MAQSFASVGCILLLAIVARLPGNTSAATTKFTDPITGSNSGRHLLWTCGKTGKKCCAGKKPCKAASAGCVFGTCRLPCGGLHMNCCNGFNGALDFSGSSGSRSCNRNLGLVCYHKKCVRCGKLGQPCCKDGQACQTSGTTCDAKTSLCVACGRVGKRCCEGGPPCNDLSKNYCKTSSNICVPKPCGGDGKSCCAGKTPCKVPKSQCIDGKCKSPCGGLNMRCCNGFEGSLDFSGSSGSRSCDRVLGITCYKHMCKPCGSKGQPCCADSGTGCKDIGSTCNYTSGTCVGCGGLSEQCCVGGPPCVDLDAHMCSSTDASSGTCVVRE